MTTGEERWAPGGAGWAAVFEAIDSGNADAFAAFLTTDGEFRFGNAPAIRGRQAVRDAVATFFAAIRGCRHRLIASWSAPGSAVCEGEVTYTRLDGTQITLPFVNVFTLRGGEIESYRIFIDNSPLFAP